MKKSALLAKKALIAFLAFLVAAVPLFSPVRAHAAGSMFTAISSQLDNSFALDSQGRIWAWGANNSGEFGNGTTIGSATPKRIEIWDNGVPVYFQEVKTGWNASIALDTAGNLWTTGDDGNGLLGNGTDGSSLVWQKLTLMDGGASVTFEKIAALRLSMFALDTDGALWAWGTRTFTADPQVPLKQSITDPDNGTPVTFEALEGNEESALALDESGRLWSILAPALNPSKFSVSDGGTEVEFQSIAVGSGLGAGTYLNLALDKNGKVWTWGGDDKGQLGDGPGVTATTWAPGKLSVADAGIPVIFTQLSGGLKHVLALDSNGDMWAWGKNDNGQLGNHSTTDSPKPIKVAVLDDNGDPLKFSSVSAGYDRSFGLDSSGQIWAWGNIYQSIPTKLKIAPYISLTASKTSLAYGEPVTLTASVTGEFDSPAGTVSFWDGGTSLGSALLTAGTAQWVVPSLPAGSHQLTARYGGNDTYLSQTSNQVSVSAAANPAKAITSFSFASPAATGIVNETDKTINVTVPYDTNATALTPTIAHSGASISPNTGVAQDFTNPVTYTVTAADGTTQTYTVTVTVAASPAKAITAFGFTNPAVTGAINEADNTIAVTVPYATYAGALSPTIVHTGASISPNSGVVQDFTNPVTYTVTAADGTTQTYTVTVTEEAPTYAIAPLAAQTAAVLTQGYAAGAQETKTITITRTGTGILNHLAVTVTGANADAFTFTALTETTLDQNTPTSSFTIKAKDGLAAGTYNAHITVSADQMPNETFGLTQVVQPVSTSSPSTGDSDSDTSNTGSTSSNTGGTVKKALADVLLNREVIPDGAISAPVSNERLTISANQSKLDNMLVSEGSHNVLTFRTKESYASVVFSLDSEFAQSLAQRQAFIELQTERGTYRLAAQQLDLDSLIRQFGESVALKDIKLEIGIHSQAEAALTAPNGGTTTSLTPQISFTIQAKYGEQIVDVTAFDTYVEHSIALPDHAGSTVIPTAVVVERDGAYRPIPTQSVVIDGKRYAKVKSLSNNTYIVVAHEIAFSDTANHWAEQAINEMGARMLVNGMEDGQYKPDQAMTRAEFAAILVRGLGLPQVASGTAFSDVAGDDWYRTAVQTAAYNDLITGFEDGTFRPNDIITREQAMVILSRAMTLTGLDAKLSLPSVDEALNPYTDAASASDWARSEIAQSIQAGIINGKSRDTLALHDSMTRAEVAAIIQRLLQQSGLI